MSATVSALIVAAAQNAGLNPALALEVATTESSLNPNVPNGAAGEVGVFQILPSTAPGVNLYDLQTNINTGVAILANLLGVFGGDPVSAVAAYNCGQSCVQNAQANYGSNWFSYIPSSTQSYVSKVLGNVQTQYSAALNPAPLVTGTATMPLQASLVPAPASSSIWGTLGIAAAVLFGLGFVLNES